MPSADDMYEAYAGVVNHPVGIVGPPQSEMMILRSQAKIGRETLVEIFHGSPSVRRIRLPSGKVVTLIDHGRHIKSKQEEE